MARSNEVFWWTMFSKGGLATALFIPVFIVITGFVLPFGAELSQLRYEHLQNLLSFWLTRAVLSVVIAGGFFHCAHRIRHTAMDLGLRSADTMLKILGYGGALICTALTVLVVINI